MRKHEEMADDFSCRTADFQFDEELNRTKVHDEKSRLSEGWSLTRRSSTQRRIRWWRSLRWKIARHCGSCYFPRLWEKRQWLGNKQKVFISGRVRKKTRRQVADQKSDPLRGKTKLWIQFPDKDVLDEEQIVYRYTWQVGRRRRGYYIAPKRAVKRPPKNRIFRSMSRFKQVNEPFQWKSGKSGWKAIENTLNNVD